jgi:uncharacterized protein (TIGR00725 family)
VTLYVSVCGPSQSSEIEDRNARAVGRLLAERSVYVVCSGDTGVPAAAAAGVRDAGGTCIGIFWGADRPDASGDYSIVLPTGMGEATNALVVRAADALIAVGGSWGTLSEIALAVRRGDVPVVTLGGWKLLDQHGRALPGIHTASGPQEAVDLALGLAAS